MTGLGSGTLFGPPIPPRMAARRLGTSAMRKGFKPEALHAYTDRTGTPLYWRVRLKNPANGEKYIRPMQVQGMVYSLSEPDFPEGKPLYRAHDLETRPAETVIVTEGEFKADQLMTLGLLVTTSGAADSAVKADWQPLAGRDILIWPDHDDAGQRYGDAVAAALTPLGCTVRTMNVAALGLGAKGDAADWLLANPGATAAVVLALPCLDSPSISLQGDNDAEVDPANVDEALEKARLIVLKAAGGDVGAPFEDEALISLRKLQDSNHAEWMRVRKQLKDAGVGVTELDRRLRGPGGGDEDEQNVTDKLVGLARDRCELIHDANGETYAVFEAAGARQVLRLDSKAFSEFLSHAYYSLFDRAPNEPALRVALSTLKGQAKFDGEQREVFVRIARTAIGYWLDLCNGAWQSVHIDASGWRVGAGGEVPLFTRGSSMRPLPTPVRGGTLNDLWPLINIPVPDRLMVVAWMLECLRSDTPHVVLELVGEQGSVKSTTQKILRRLIDPNQADLRAAPKSVEDVWIAAQNSHMVSFENLSHLSPPYQDALCVLATGGGFATRTLYTNAEETILELRKPVVLNGISVIVTAQDLLDRCLHIDLPTVEKRELASVMEARFEAAQPKLLGALLDLFVRVLARLPGIEIAPDKRPRMADFAALGEAVFQVCGDAPGAFLARYNTKRADGVHRTIDSSPVGAALLSFLESRTSGWTGTLKELLQALEVHRPHGAAWPGSAKGLGDAIRRLSPALRMLNVDCTSTDKVGGVIRWTIARREKPPAASPASPASPGRDVAGGQTAGHPGHAGHGGANNSRRDKAHAEPADEGIV